MIAVFIKYALLFLSTMGFGFLFVVVLVFLKGLLHAFHLAF